MLGPPVETMPRLQYPLIKEYTLKSLKIRIGILIRFKVYSLIKGYWSLWMLHQMYQHPTVAQAEALEVNIALVRV